jgi:Secretion system C-terminal sorting domain
MPDDFYFSLICNPCQEIVNFKIANSLLVSSLVLCDNLGKEVSNLTVSEGINSIPANTLKNGVYTLALKLNSGKTICKKLVIAN